MFALQHWQIIFLLGEKEAKQTLPRMDGKCTPGTRYRVRCPSVLELVAEVNKLGSALFLLE